MLPQAIQAQFIRLFDDAPQVPYSTVERVFMSEFGRPPAGPNGIFEIFEEQAAASASIAQVHRAKLKTDDGSEKWVAVKVQKPDVGKQVNWDLTAFRAVMWVYEHWLFHLPVTFATGACSLCSFYALAETNSMWQTLSRITYGASWTLRWRRRTRCAWPG